MTSETKQKAMRAIGFLEGFSAWVWAHVGEDENLAPEFAGAYDDYVEELRKAVMSEETEEMGYEFVNTLFTDEWYSDAAMKERGVVQVPLCYLAKSLENMSLCHAAYFAKGWETARGCRIEHDAAVAYGLDVIYED